VPYEGSAGSVTALAGSTSNHAEPGHLRRFPIQAGKLRPLLLFSDKRDPYMPDVPIPKDLGYEMSFIRRCAASKPRPTRRPTS